jgi:hypothetical protein
LDEVRGVESWHVTDRFVRFLPGLLLLAGSAYSHAAYDSICLYANGSHNYCGASELAGVEVIGTCYIVPITGFGGGKYLTFSAWYTEFERGYYEYFQSGWAGASCGPYAWNDYGYPTSLQYILVPPHPVRHYTIFDEQGRLCWYDTPSFYPDCSNVVRPYRISLSRADGQSESAAILTSVEPGEVSALVVRVYDQSNQVVTNVNVRLEADAVEKSGGHQHPNAPDRPRGSLGGAQPTPHVITGNTGSNGFSFSFHAPAVAGDHILTATCTDGKNCTQEGPKQVWVGVKGLEPIAEPVDPVNGVLYTLIRPNADEKHPRNHYLTPQAAARLIRLAYLYRTCFLSDPPLHLNDASLERGGLFDIKAKDGTSWTVPHKTHRFGTEIDIRANPTKHPTTSIPERNFERFEAYVRAAGATTCPAVGPAYRGTDNQHYHVCLAGGSCCQ